MGALLNSVRRTLLLLGVALLIASMLVATAALEFVTPLDLSSRRLLGIEIIVLTAIVAFLASWPLPLKQKHLDHGYEKIWGTRQDSPSGRSREGPVRQQEKRSEGPSEGVPFKGSPFRAMWRQRRP